MIDVIIDAHNIYVRLKQKYGPDARLSYAKYLDFCKTFGEVEHCVVISQRDDTTFNVALENLGIKVIPNANIIDFAIACLGSKNSLVLGTADDRVLALFPEVTVLTVLGARVGNAFPKKLEIPSTLLEQ